MSVVFEGGLSWLFVAYRALKLISGCGQVPLARVSLQMHAQ